MQVEKSSDMDDLCIQQNRLIRFQGWISYNLMNVYGWLQQFQECIQGGQDKMNQINNFSVEPINTLHFHSQEDLNKSLDFSARSHKEHSISQTNCSHLSTQKIVIDSEEELDREWAEGSQICQSYHFEGSCQDGQNCGLIHNRLKAKSPIVSKSLLLEKFPQLVTMSLQRSRSFLE